MIPDIESFRLVPHMTNIIEYLKKSRIFPMIHMGVARKWHFSTLGVAANLGGAPGDLYEHRGSGISLLRITSLSIYKLTGLSLINSYEIKAVTILVIKKHKSRAKQRNH